MARKKHLRRKLNRDAEGEPFFPVPPMDLKTFAKLPRAPLLSTLNVDSPAAANDSSASPLTAAALAEAAAMDANAAKEQVQSHEAST